MFALHCAPARGLRERALETFLSMFLETFVKSARSAIFVGRFRGNTRFGKASREARFFESQNLGDREHGSKIFAPAAAILSYKSL